MLFDTTFLIDIERETKRNRQGPARSFLRQNPNSTLFVSVISVSEFAEGFESGREQDCWNTRNGECPEKAPMPGNRLGGI
jgi:hypothetical protein